MGQVLRHHSGDYGDFGRKGGVKGGGGLVLLGDQMQLPSPSEGNHPGLSALSALEYLLATATNPATTSATSTTSTSSTSSSAIADPADSGGAVVPGHLGVFLPVSYRLHPSLCSLLSDQVYDGSLRSHPTAATRSLVLLGNDSRRLVSKRSGVCVLPVLHTNHAQQQAVPATSTLSSSRSSSSSNNPTAAAAAATWGSSKSINRRRRRW
mmetsp:Transcript_19921/g.39507  ORF Transcript_19921/g.39507 Transcript_19921/m.39507 type:complete len:209 (-) Transcript_19921:134-760(-)